MVIKYKTNELHIADSFVEILKKVKGFSEFFKDVLANTVDNLELYFTDCKINYLSYRYEDNGLISYCPEGKVQQFRPDGKWMRKDRQTGKPAKVLKKIFSELLFNEYIIQDNDLSLISTCCKVNMDFSNVYESTHINEVYTYETTDWTNISCMQNKGYMFFIEKLGGRIAYIMNADNKLEGRALIWPNVTCSSKNAKITVLDRQYGTDEARIKLQAYGQSKGYYVREKNNVDNTYDFITPNGEFVELKLEVEHNGIIGGLMPYLDTFRWLNSDKCYNNENNKNYGLYEANNTDGTLSGDDDHNNEVETDLEGWVYEDTVRICGHCDNTGGEDSFEWSNTENYDVCYSCRERYFVRDENDEIHLESKCAYCEGTNTYHYNTENLNYSDYHKTYIEKANSIYCDFTKDFYYNDEVKELQTAKGTFNVFKEELDNALCNYGHPNLEPTNQ